MNRMLISAAHKSSGKTVVSLGLCAAFAGRGLAVQPFKKGPDYIDPMWLGRAARRACHNVDFHTMSSAEIRSTFSNHAADLAIVEGTKGLYDGVDPEGADSNAALARMLGLPVILVLDTRGVTRGIAPLLLGYRSFDERVQIAGVILNQVGGPRHEDKLRAAVERYTDVPVLGALQHDSSLRIIERHLGLMPSNEHENCDAAIQRIAEAVASQVDLDSVLDVASHAPLLAPVTDALNEPAPRAPDVRIGIARDAAFGFYYADDIDAMARAGAELICIDTLHDSALPDVDAVFIGGGFPEMQVEALATNTSLHAAIRRFVDDGRPVYAECGGLMYLARSLTWQGQSHDMVGAIPADVVMQSDPQGRGYVRLRETGIGPWPVLDPDRHAHEIAAHEFHYSSLQNLGPQIGFAYDVLRGHGMDGRRDGLVYKNVFASYAHLRDTQSNPWTRRFVAHVRRLKRASTPVLADVAAMSQAR
ncbi:MAG: cobyrinate a,c-diamide synthase [Gammaproteobacteria bacterium]